MWRLLCCVVLDSPCSKVANAVTDLLRRFGRHRVRRISHRQGLHTVPPRLAALAVTSGAASGGLQQQHLLVGDVEDTGQVRRAEQVQVRERRPACGPAARPVDGRDELHEQECAAAEAHGQYCTERCMVYMMKVIARGQAGRRRRRGSALREVTAGGPDNPPLLMRTIPDDEPHERAGRPLLLPAAVPLPPRRACRLLPFMCLI